MMGLGLFCSQIMSGYGQNISLMHSHQPGFGLSVNTAMSLLGSRGSVAIMNRQQWIGVEGAPQVTIGSGYLSLEQLGAATGISVRQDRIGVETQSEAFVFFSKAVRLSERDYLGVSLNLGMINYKAGFSSLDGSDPSFRDDVVKWDGLLGIGLLYFRPEKYYFGGSLPRLTFGGVGILGNEKYNFQNEYLLMGGMLLDMGEGFVLRPSLQVNYSRGTGMGIDGSAMIFLHRKVGIGIGGRTQGDCSGLLRLNISGFGLGYAYQFNLSDQKIQRYLHRQSHEIGLVYSFDTVRGLL